MGDDTLSSLLKNLSLYPHARKIIGIFDRDNPKYISDIGDSKDFGNNVHAFCIPIPTNRKDYSNISLEFYYADAELKKDHNGKCLYFDNEVIPVPQSEKSKKLIKLTQDQK